MFMPFNVNVLAYMTMRASCDWMWVYLGVTECVCMFSHLSMLIWACSFVWMNVRMCSYVWLNACVFMWEWLSVGVHSCASGNEYMTAISECSCILVDVLIWMYVSISVCKWLSVGHCVWQHVSMFLYVTELIYMYMCLWSFMLMCELDI